MQTNHVLEKQYRTFGEGVGSSFLNHILTSEQIRQLEQKRHAILQHPLWTGIAKGTTSKAHLATFALQDAWLIDNVHVLDGLAIAKAPCAKSANYIIQKLIPKGEGGNTLQDFGKAMGLTEAELATENIANIVPLAGCSALTTAFYYYLVRKSFVEAIAFIGASESIFLELCGLVETPLKDTFALTDADVRFFSFHKMLEPAEKSLNQLFSHLVDNDITRQKIFQAISFCYDCEKAFYDTVLAHPHQTLA